VTTTPPLADVVCHVRRVLEQIGDALVIGRVETLLETEDHLASALRTLTAALPSRELSPDEQARLRPEIAACLSALHRCRRLGASMDAVVAVALTEEGRVGTYTRAGRAGLLPPSGALEARG
jgi:hypothetical protein